MKRLVVFGAAILCGWVSLALADGINILVNPGFESGSMHGTPTGWTLSHGVAVKNAGGHNSDSYLYTYPDGVQAGLYQDVDVRPNGTYSMSFWKIHTGLADYWCRGYFDVADPDGTVLASCETHSDEGTLGQWFFKDAGTVNVGNRTKVRVWARSSPNYWESAIGIDDMTFACDPPYIQPGLLNGTFQGNLGWLQQGGNVYFAPGGGHTVDGSGFVSMYGTEAGGRASVTTVLTGLYNNINYTLHWFSCQSPGTWNWHRVKVLDMAGNVVADTGELVSSSGDWVQESLQFNSGTYQKVKVVVLSSPNSWETQVGYDDFTLTHDPYPANLIQNGEFSNGMSNWNYWGGDGAVYEFGPIDTVSNRWDAPASIASCGSVFLDWVTGNSAPSVTVLHNPAWGSVGYYQIVPVTAGSQYTVNADWKSSTGITVNHCWAEFIVYDATLSEVNDMTTVLQNVNSTFTQNSIVAKKDTWPNLNGGASAWDWQPIAQSMGGGFAHAMGTNVIVPKNPYLVVLTKFGGDYTGAAIASFQFDNVRVEKTGSASLPGDANLDGRVDVSDLGILAANYGKTANATWAMGDFSNDGKVDVSDLGILAAHYGTGAVGNVDFNKEAKALGFSIDDTDQAVKNQDTPVTSTLGCGSAGLPLIAGLFLAMMMLSETLKVRE